VKYLDANRVNLKADSFTAGLLALKKKSLAKSGFSNLALNLASVILREIWVEKSLFCINFERKLIGLPNVAFIFYT